MATVDTRGRRWGLLLVNIETMHQFASVCLALGNVKVFNPETFFAWLKVSSSFPLQKNSLPFFPFSLYPQNYLTTLHYVTSRWGATRVPSLLFPAFPTALSFNDRGRGAHPNNRNEEEEKSWQMRVAAGGVENQKARRPEKWWVLEEQQNKRLFSPDAQIYRSFSPPVFRFACSFCFVLLFFYSLLYELKRAVGIQ